jgi:peptide/nickel transport system substrate-binding protein
MPSRWKTALVAVSAAAALSLAVAGCSTPEESPDAPDSIRIGITPDQLAGDYNLATTSLFPLSAGTMYESLFARSTNIETGGFGPNIATGYERSEDWKTVTLTLRDDVTYVDGEKLTAGTVKEYLDGMNGTEGWWFQSTWDLNSPTLTAVDDTTLEFTSDKPMTLRFRGFLHSLFTAVAIASPKALDDLEASAADPIGTGPYVIESSTPEVGMTLVRNEGYWNTEAFPFDEIELTVFADDVAALNALKAGQIDATKLSIPLGDEAANEGFTINLAPRDRNVSLYIADREGTTNPAFADPRVRQAMAYAFDREAINESLNRGYGVVSTQPFSEGQAEYVPDGDDRYAYDPDRARELLAEAGYADGFDLVIPSTTFLGLNSWEPVVQQYLGDIGIRVTFDSYPDVGAYFTAATSDTSYPVLMYAEGPISTLPVFITSDAVFNPFKIQDPVVDDLWAKVQSGPDDVADEAAAELGAYVVDESILIVFSAPGNIWATAPGFVVENKDGYPDLMTFQYEG